MSEVETCRKCGTPRLTGQTYCVTCGTRWPRRRADDVEPAAWAGPGFAAGPPRARRSWGRVALTVAVAVLLAGGGLGFVLTRGEGGGHATAFALRFTEGRTYRYRFAMRMDGRVAAEQPRLSEPLHMTLDATMSLRVRSVAPDGTVTADETLEEASVSVGGQSQPLPTGTTIRVRIARDGRMLSGGALSAIAEGSQALAPPGLDQFTPLLPDHPVRPGDTWSKDFSISFPLGGGTLRYETRNRFDRYETVGGVRTAVITSDMTTPVNFTLDLREVLARAGQSAAQLPAGMNPEISYGGQMTFRVTNWLQPDTGQQVRSRAAGRFDLRIRLRGFPQEPGVPRGEVRMTGTMSLSVDRLS